MSQFTDIQTKCRLDGIAEKADENFENIDRTLRRLVEAQEQSFSTKQVRYFQGLVGLLSTSDYNRQMRLNPNRVPGTCEWFCNHETFKKWLSTDTGLLLVSADPGCGKSTLARYLIEEALPQQDPGSKVSLTNMTNNSNVQCTNRTSKVIYFFFKDTNEQRQLNTALCAVLHQMLLDDNALVNSLQRDIVQTGVRVKDNTTILWKMFSEACQNPTSGIICVFDALDECNPEDCLELIRNIKGIVQRGLGIKFLITIRGYPRLLNQFKTYESGLIHLDGDGKQEKDEIQKEISLVLDYKLDHLSKTKGLDQQPERKAAIEKAFRSKGSEQRTYLWMKLVFDIMERIPWKSDSDWKKMITSPPRDVNDAYATLLQNVPESEKAYVKVLLQLMVVACRPLTLREMSIAIIARDNPGADDEKALGLQPDHEFKDWILQTCGFFVTIYDNHLYFIHQTAKEFLVSSGQEVSWPQGLDWFSPVTETLAHVTMAESSIAYLSLKSFHSRQFHERAALNSQRTKINSSGLRYSQDEQSINTEYGFLDYTTRFWAQHFKLCQSFRDANFRDIGDAFRPHYLPLFTTEDCQFPPGWISLHFRYLPEQADNGPLGVFIRDGTVEVDLLEGYDILDAALWFDHGRLLVHSLNTKMCSKETLLYTAAGLNAANCIQYFAATGVDINVQDKSGATALCVAASHKATEAADMLLDCNADVNLSAGLDELPLSYIIQHYSRASGYPQLLRRVVCRGADLNSTRVKYFGREGVTTPLAWAAEIPMYTFELRDNAGKIQRLDDWMQRKISASVFDNVADYLQQVDLFTAEEFLDAYNQSLIKLLLDNGADIDGAVADTLSEGRPRTALEHACFRVSVGSTSHVFWNAAFLLHGGADGTLNTETGRSALDWLLRAWLEMEDYLPSPVSWGRQFYWDALGVLLLKKSPASAYINNPIPSEALKTRLHSIADFGTYRRGKAKLLLDHGAEVNCRDLYGRSPIHYLVPGISDLGHQEAVDILDMFIAHGADLGAQDSLGKTPMHHNSSVDVFRVLLNHGADLEVRDSKGNTPLQCLVACDPPQEALEFLIVEMGASQTTINHRGETLRHIAANTGLITGLEYVFTGDVSLECVDKEGKTPLQAALDHRSHAVAALLLKLGVDPSPLLLDNFDIEQRDRTTGATLLAFVSKIHACDAAEILLQHGANPNSRVNDFTDEAVVMQTVRSYRLMYEAQDREYPASFVAGPQERADSYCEDEMPLHLVMRNTWTCDAETTANLLLKHGADIEARSRQQKTPFQVAWTSGNKEGALYLLKMGADANSTTSQGESALSTACMAWSVDHELVRDLLTHGATTTAGYHNGFDLLCRIAGSWSNSPDETSCIGDSHTSLQDPSNLGRSTPCCCRQCCREHERKACTAAQILLDSGALIGVSNPLDDKISPSRIARIRGWLDLAKLLGQADTPHHGSVTYLPAWLQFHAKSRKRLLPAGFRPSGVGEDHSRISETSNQIMSS